MSADLRLSPSARTALVLLGLALAVTVTYSSTPLCEFIPLDDSGYVYLNPHLQFGPLWERILWTFTTLYSSNWHPLTWLSHLLDVELFGLVPAGHHAVNALLHLANTLALFLALRTLTRDFWRSAVVAALFGLHPLQVESVAWISSRKGLLSALFGFLGLWSYGAYARRPSRGAYALTLLFLALSLSAKQTFVVFPFLLLLLDYWPLGRFEREGPFAANKEQRSWRLVLDKAPMLLLATIASWLTVVAQTRSGAVAPLGAWAFYERLTYALAGCWRYLLSAVYPHDLAVLYPLSRRLPYADAALGLVAVTLGCLLAWRLRRKAGWLFTGWFWFLLALGPVIGLVQIGLQSRADRYMYIPLIGLALILCWAFPLLLQRAPQARRLCAYCALAALLVLAAATYRQTQYWRNGIALFSRAIEVTERNDYMYYNLFSSYKAAGDLPEAERALQEAARLFPGMRRYTVELTSLLYERGKFEEAIAVGQGAIQKWPDDYELRNALGGAYGMLRRYPEALEHFERALALRPDDPGARHNVETARKKLRAASSPLDQGEGK